MSEKLRHDRTDLMARAWALLLIVHAEAAGLSPLSRTRLHGALYLAFALARAYDVAPLSHLVLREVSGPLYPNVQREVGRLVLSGLLLLSDYRPKPIGNRGRSNGTFRLTAKGREIATELMQVPRLDSIGKLLSDVAFGLGELKDQSLEQSMRADPTYTQPGKSDGQIIRFEDAADNRSLAAVVQIQQWLGEIAPPSQQDVLVTFAEVLQRRALA